MNCYRVYVIGKGGRKPPASVVQKYFKCERVISVSHIGDGVFSVVMNSNIDPRTLAQEDK